MQYDYVITDTTTNEVNPSKLSSEIVDSSISTNLTRIDRLGSNIYIVFDSALSSGDKTTLDGLVAAHEHITSAESLKIYLQGTVFPFIDDLIARFAAENIALGITQAGKTGDVLGLFEKGYDIGALHPVSLKGSFDTGSLYVSRDIIQHVRDNPTEFTGLSPFVTDARLLAMKNEIEVFLGITPLST